MKPPNVALERLAHATTNKDYSPASPLKALVMLRGPLTNYHVDFALPLVINFMETVFIDM
jgi:hypothetical protein